MTSKTPGPGHYADSDVLSKGRYVRSNERNSAVPLIKLPINPENVKRVVALDVAKDIPGPGSYTPRVTRINNTYRNTLSINLY